MLVVLPSCIFAICYCENGYTTYCYTAKSYNGSHEYKQYIMLIRVTIKIYHAPKHITPPPFLWRIVTMPLVSCPLLLSHIINMHQVKHGVKSTINVTPTPLSKKVLCYLVFPTSKSSPIKHFIEERGSHLHIHVQIVRNQMNDMCKAY